MSRNQWTLVPIAATAHTQTPQGLPALVVNRGGEYCFVPSLSALRWLSELDTYAG